MSTDGTPSSQDAGRKGFARTEWDSIDVTDAAGNREDNDPGENAAPPSKKERARRRTTPQRRGPEPSSVLVKYPFCGEIIRCTDRGFGFLNGPTGEEWIHFRDHSGRRLNTMEGMEGKVCAYALVSGKKEENQRRSERVNNTER